jgi:branched-chain amino acid transport system permease protein
MKKFVFTIIFFLALAILPFIGIDRYYMRFLTYLFMWAALAQCWNISSGYTGYIDFGPVAYFGLGAYLTSISMTLFHHTFLFSIISGAIVSVFVALIISMPTLKLKGAYFAIATFAFAESLKQVVLSFDRTFHVNFFNGSHGITLPISTNYKMFFYSMLFISFILFLLTFFIAKSKIGLALKAIGESENVSELIGINTTLNKIIVYLLSAFFISIIGGIYAYWVTYITPDDVFSVHKTVQMVIMTLLGGMGTIYGPLMGAVFLSGISEFLGAEFVENYLIIVGFIVIFIILLEPEGIYGFKKWKKYLKLKI